jgi:hypothetical protein
MIIAELPIVSLDETNKIHVISLCTLAYQVYEPPNTQPKRCYTDYELNPVFVEPVEVEDKVVLMPHR